VIRLATIEDVDAVAAMGARFIAQSRYGRLLPIVPEQLEAFTAQLVAGEASAVFVAEHAGALVGMFGVLLFEHPMSGVRVATEVFWWVEPSARGLGLRLFYTAQRWAKDRGAAVLQMIAPSDEVRTLYERLGFDQVETVYQRAIA
jgi:GNAT superfamily N-acetyltransferase